MSSKPTGQPETTRGGSAQVFVATKEKNGTKLFTFDELAGEDDEVWIEHAGQNYRLRRTRHDKLVLSK
jgi:hemin uptake protein HemP